MNTLIYPFVFYVSSLIITLPFLRFFKYGDARYISILTLTLITYSFSYLFPFKEVFYVVFSCFIVAAFVSVIFDKEGKIKIDKEELIFVAVFSYVIFLRYLDPTILDCEKFMDSAFMNAVLKAKVFPPNDPFLAGGKLNFYYYFGHVMAACVTLMSSAPPEVGYNIAVAVLPAYSALLIYTILKSKSKLAYFGIAFAMFSGDLYSVVDFVRRLVYHIPFNFLYYWNATRVIKGTINEFPYFSFIHADLHAHVSAIPIKILIILMLYRIWRERDKKAYFIIPPALFALFATNAWDYPLIFLACIMVAIAIRDKSLVVATIVSILPVYVLYSSMITPEAKIEFVHTRSNIVQFLMYAAFPVVIAYIFSANRKIALASIPFAIAAYFVSPVLALLLPLAVSSIYKTFKGDFVGALVFVGCLAFIIPEFLAVQSRLNTVFKFYLVGWLLLTIPPALNFEWRGYKKVILVSLLILGLVYPMVATPIRYSARYYTLDGMAFMKGLAGDYWAVKWLQNKNGVTIEEGCTQGALCAYRYGGRVAAFTGNPDVIAWTAHEYVWRDNYTLVAERAKDVRTFYTTNSCKVMYSIVKKYHIKYIFVGYEERKVFGVTPKKFEKCFKLAFKYDGTAVFYANTSNKVNS